MSSDDELVFNVLVQLEDEPPANRRRILAACLASEFGMLTPDEIVMELISVRFKLMRINGVLHSEGHPSAWLEGAYRLVERDLLHRAPEAE